jgi:hypothetical protein
MLPTAFRLNPNNALHPAALRPMDKPGASH